MKPVKDESISLERIVHLCRDLLEKKSKIKSINDFVKETDCAKIIAFDLIQISETFSRLDDETKSRFRCVSEATIKGMRNVLVHDYGRINGSLVKATLDEDIDPLLRETQKIIEDINR